MNGPMFLAYVKQCLAPTLRRGDIVIVDNVPAHRVAGVNEAIEAVGARLLYLPPYLPDLNPIELAISKVKADLRKACERTIPRLSRRDRTDRGRFLGKRAQEVLSPCRLCSNLSGIRSKTSKSTQTAVVYQVNSIEAANLLVHADRPDGQHYDDDRDELQQHAKLHQLLRAMGRAAARQVREAEQQHDRHRAERNRDEGVYQELGHAAS